MVASSTRSRVSKLENQSRDRLLATTRQVLVELQALSSRIAAVQEIATAINRSLNLEQIFQVIGQQAKWILDFDHCSVCLQAESNERKIISLFGMAAESVPLHPNQGSPIDRAIQTKQSQLIHDNANSDESTDCLSLIIIPLESEGEVLGTINFASQAAHVYSQDDLRIGYLLALQLSTAVRNAQRFEQVNHLYAQLEGAYDDLRKAETLRQDLANMIVHDLRNPLMVIMGNLSLVEQATDYGLSSNQQSKLLGGALESSQDMMRLIEDILNVGKFEAGELTITRSALELSSLLQEKKQMFQTQAAQENKQLIIHDPGDKVPVLEADVGLISRVLENLLSNAFKYTASNGIIELGTTLQAKTVKLYVRDDGEGIPPEFQAQIFDKFIQVTDEAGQSLRKGTGLGLAFCHMVIEAHDGEIWVDSVPGQGSTFSFTLPINSKN